MSCLQIVKHEYIPRSKITIYRRNKNINDKMAKKPKLKKHHQEAHSKPAKDHQACEKEWHKVWCPLTLKKR